MPDLTGKIHRLSHYRGRIVIVNFWSAECPWAERADRDLVSYLPKWGARVALLTVAANVNESDEPCAEASRTRSLPLVLRASSEVLEVYGVQVTPHLFVIDADGVLRYRGAFDDVSFRQREPTCFFLKDAVDDLLAGRLPEIQESAPYGCTIVRFMLKSNRD